MQHIRPATFTAPQAWAALPIATIEGATVRLHWTDQPYRWHVNDGDEVFVPLDGAVDMHVREGEQTRVLHLAPGDIFHAQAGDAHVAHPQGAVRVLVIEKAGSL